MYRNRVRDLICTVLANNFHELSNRLLEARYRGYMQSQAYRLLGLRVVATVVVVAEVAKN